ncbi:hypothetical protein ACTZWT_02505 [Rhodopseudomonas sp. NSM]|uniref:hypothetical protein n=1 Tax=Rhodopseudomonas sp. NSM TaxID=3457630 RepID=UPI004035CC29
MVVPLVSGNKKPCPSLRKSGTRENSSGKSTNIHDKNADRDLKNAAIKPKWLYIFEVSYPCGNFLRIRESLQAACDAPRHLPAEHDRQGAIDRASRKACLGQRPAPAEPRGYPFRHSGALA